MNKTQPRPRPCWILYLGRDEWGNHRYADLSGLTGITVGGLPGYGKTSLTLSLLFQLAVLGAVQFVFIDGKGGGDYNSWADRAWLTCGDDLADAASIFTTVEDLMKSRLEAVGTIPGPRNRWDLGPTPEYPWIVLICDECHSFFDLEAVKGDKEAEAHVRRCRTAAAQLVKKGRSVLFTSLFLTQKQTGDAIPTAIRDNCGLGFSFAVRTRDAAIAGLGEAIKQYPSYCPTTLQEKPTFIGVCTASLPTGTDPFVRLRVPRVTEAAADARALDLAHLRRDPEQLHNGLLTRVVEDARNVLDNLVLA